MKILYITFSGKWKNRYSVENEIIDFEPIIANIIEGIKAHFPDVSISLPKDLYDVDKGAVSHDKLDDFDLAICDITGSVPNVHFLSGVIQGKGIPVIYMSNRTYDKAVDIGGFSVLLYSEDSLNKEFINELNIAIESAKNDPTHFVVKKQDCAVLPKAFISYSHNDKDYLCRLLVHLKPLEKKGLIDVWQDSKIKIGDRWQVEIEKALCQSSIAILMLSADFMASDFIVENELPPLLAKAEVLGTKIVPVILSPCRFDREPSLNRFQAANLPTEPLSKMSAVEREFIYDKIASDIELALKKENK